MAKAQDNPLSRQYLLLADGRYVRTNMIRELFIGPSGDGKHAIKIEPEGQPVAVVAEFETLKEAKAALEGFMGPISARIGA